MVTVEKIGLTSAKLLLVVVVFTQMQGSENVAAAVL